MNRADVLTLSEQNKELKIEVESLQTKLEDVQEEIEHSLLDKEIAESELEEEKARIKALEERLGELEVEVGVFREENGEETRRLISFHGHDMLICFCAASARLEGPPAEEGAPDEPGSGGVSSLAYRHLEKQNLRLKDALLR